MKYLVYGLLLVGSFILSYSLVGMFDNTEMPKHAIQGDYTSVIKDADVVLYTLEGCAACAKTKQYLSDENIVYQERKIEDAEHRAQFNKLNQPYTPLLITKTALIVGFNQQEFDAHLKP